MSSTAGGAFFEVEDCSPSGFCITMTFAVTVFVRPAKVDEKSEPDQCPLVGLFLSALFRRIARSMRNQFHSS